MASTFVQQEEAGIIIEVRQEGARERRLPSPPTRANHIECTASGLHEAAFHGRDTIYGAIIGQKTVISMLATHQSREIYISLAYFLCLIGSSSTFPIYLIMVMKVQWTL